MRHPFTSAAALSMPFALAIAHAQQPAFSFQGASSSDGVGAAVAFADDTNGDGYDDFLIGVPGSNSSTGHAELRSGADGSLLHAFSGSAPFTSWGTALDGLGDVDADGNGDVVVASPWAGTPVNSARGRVIAYSGSSGNALWQLDGSTSNDKLGWSVVGTGDLDADGRNDVLLALPGFDVPGGPANAGRVRAHSGATGQLLYQVDGTLPNGEFGQLVAALGDIDADGVRDWMASATNATNDNVLVCSGRTGALLHAYAGTVAADGWGVGLAGIGDANGDGVADLVIGKNATLGIYSGASFALIREKSYSATIGGPGSPIARAGDMNADGVDDILAHSATLQVLSGATLGALWSMSGSITSMDGGADFNHGGRPDVLSGDKLSGGASFAGRAELRMPFDMLLTATPNPVNAGTPVALHNRAGIAGRPVGTLVTAVNGAPLLQLATSGVFNAAGTWTWSTVPTAAAIGLSLTVVNVSTDATLANLRFSNPVTVLIQ